MKKSVWTIPHSLSFADTLAAGIWNRIDHDIARLPDVTILLPNRRACREMAHAFLRVLDGRATLLPKLFPLGDLDEDELFFYSLDQGDDIIKIPSAIGSLQRQIHLAAILQEMFDAENKENLWSSEHVMALAGDLGLLLDQLQIEEIDPEKIMDLVADDFSHHWQNILGILKAIIRIWPEKLKSLGLIDPVTRRNTLLNRQAEFWRKNPPNNMIVAAGSTGTMPATARLLKVVSELPKGYLVLPGVDQYLDDNSWKNLEATHPQYSLKKLLETIECDRANIELWQAEDKNNPSVFSQDHLISEVMRPSATTDLWLSEKMKKANFQTQDVNLIELQTPTEEAEIIALILREALEEPNKTACLITPDRHLARRVKAALRRWEIDIDDSAGEPLDKSLIGQWLLLSAGIIEMFAQGKAQKFDAPLFLAFIKHPYFCLDFEKETLDELIEVLEKEKLREEKIITSIFDLPADPIVERICNDLLKIHKGDDFYELLKDHLSLCEAWARPKENILWSGDEGNAAAKKMAELLDLAGHEHYRETMRYILKGSAYRKILDDLLKKVTVRNRMPTHNRLSILGQMEARLSQADRIILGGVNEGVWPPQPETDPWLSRAMREQLGLPPAERTIGLSAHDFSKGFCAKEVFITRSLKSDGAPTIPAPWISRLKAVMHASGETVKTGEYWKEILCLLDQPPEDAQEYQKVIRPAACPPAHARPVRVSVTAIERLMRDPYSYYADKILKLRPLDPINSLLDPVNNSQTAKVKGILVHDILQSFVEDHKMDVSQEDLQTLLSFGEKALLNLFKQKNVMYQFWWSRFIKIAEWFIEQEMRWREYARPVLTEKTGTLSININDTETITLSAKFDRIDEINGEAGYHIIDYKTGAPPARKHVETGLSPQLPLEGLILKEGFFEDNFQRKKHGGQSIGFSYWHVAPNKKTRDFNEDQAGKLIADAKEGVRLLLAEFASADCFYLSKPYGEKIAQYNDYNHFIRFEEWKDGDLVKSNVTRKAVGDAA